MSYSRAIEGRRDRLVLTRILRCLGHTLARDEAGTRQLVSQERAALALDVKPWEFLRPDFSIGICAWCQQALGVKPRRGESHGICPQHMAQQLAKARALNAPKMEEAA